MLQICSKHLMTRAKPLNSASPYWLMEIGEAFEMNVFDEMGVYWAEIAEKNQTESQIQFLKKHLKPEGYILDIACGTGRHSIPLSKQGYCMVGLDVSVNLLRIAKQHIDQFQVVKGDMRFLPFKADVFAAAVSMDTSFGYLPSQKDDVQSLADCRRVVRKGGILIVDLFNREKLIAKYKEKNQSVQWKEYHSFSLLQKRTISADGNLLCDLWTIKDKASGRLLIFDHVVRLYERSEFEGLLEMTGFTVREVYGGYEEDPFRSNSHRFISMAYVKEVFLHPTKA
jgi:ubiquinone/menaquinone biosynthesis C-methylase UbiE